MKTTLLTLTLLVTTPLFAEVSQSALSADAKALRLSIGDATNRCDGLDLNANHQVIPEKADVFRTNIMEFRKVSIENYFSVAHEGLTGRQHFISNIPQKLFQVFYYYWNGQRLQEKGFSDQSVRLISRDQPTDKQLDTYLGDFNLGLSFQVTGNNGSSITCHRAPSLYVNTQYYNNPFGELIRLKNSNESYKCEVRGSFDDLKNKLGQIINQTYIYHNKAIELELYKKQVTEFGREFANAEANKRNLNYKMPAISDSIQFITQGNQIQIADYRCGIQLACENEECKLEKIK